ncbi:hypothetical protein TNCT_714541 [Trichonephila clavata]|uniref:Uncharacterized protein n=1 Tax=Trichonephila clavata TaxID=2740835 RepID=A0A8X6M2M4_TRICU|nr:hypothetical protein TNCT_714541 [Trichonephila clavata]
MKVENNNVVIWKGGKTLTVNADQIRIYQPREKNEDDNERDRSDGEGSREAEVETEGSECLAREKSTKVKQLPGKRWRSEGSDASTNNQERQHQSKTRSPERLNLQKRRASSLQEENEVKR